MCTCEHVPWHTCEGQRATFGSPLFSPWVPGIDLRMLDLHKKRFHPLSHLASLYFLLLNNFILVIKCVYVCVWWVGYVCVLSIMKWDCWIYTKNPFTHFHTCGLRCACRGQRTFEDGFSLPIGSGTWTQVVRLACGSFAFPWWALSLAPALGSFPVPTPCLLTLENPHLFLDALDLFSDRVSCNQSWDCFVAEVSLELIFLPPCSKCWCASRVCTNHARTAQVFCERVVPFSSPLFEEDWVPEEGSDFPRVTLLIDGTM